ncbi:MAG: hypothetical protein SFV18_13660 [Bryobacteraceae bacterium]|nr:hypothetical protein [Bryobacteraceae bacterium]
MAASKKAYTLRCSTIFVSEGTATRVVHSFDDLDSEVRQRLLRTTTGHAAATIFIANRGGRRELAKRLRGLPSRVRTRLEDSPMMPPPETPAPKRATQRPHAPSFATLAGPGVAPAVRQALMVLAGAATLAALVFGLN